MKNRVSEKEKNLLLKRFSAIRFSDFPHKIIAVFLAVFLATVQVAPVSAEWYNLSSTGSLEVVHNPYFAEPVSIGTVNPQGLLHTERYLPDYVDGSTNTECPAGYDQGDFDNEADNDDCRAIGIVAKENGDVGIGTTNPDAKLHVQTEPGRNAEIDIQSGNENKWGIYQDETTADLRFWNTDNRLTITDEGNVGIGTTSPDATIHVVNTNADVSLEEYQSSGTGPQLKFYKARGSALEPQSISSGTEIGKIKFSGYGETDFKQSALILARSESAFSDTSSPGYLDFETTSVGSTTPESRVRISSTGNVGIGTVSPTEKLDVAGNINFTGELNVNSSPGTNGQVLISSGDGAAPTWQNASSVGTTDHGALTGLTDDDHTQYALLAGRDGDTLAIDQVNAYDGAGLKLYDDGGNGMFVADGGNIGIGTLSPAAKLHVDGNAIFDTDSGNQKFYITRSGNIGEHAAFSVNDSDFIIEHKQDETTGVYGNVIFKMGGKVSSGQTPYFAVRNWTETGDAQSDLFKVDGTKQYLKGNVGIGTTSPTEKLDVAGNINFTGELNVNNSPGTNGQVLISSGDGAAPTWKNANTVGTTDHGALTGLTDDDHTQYALLAGRSGGQSLTGGTGSGDDLTLSSTANATKGTINLGSTAYIDEVNKRVGIGTASPSNKLHILDTNDARIYIETTNAASGGGLDIVNSTDNQSWRITGEKAGFKLRDNTAGKNIFYIESATPDNTLYIKNTGNVGIGTTSANAKLHVKTNTGTNSEIDIQTANLTHWGIYHDETTEDLRFWNTNDQVSITNTGNVSITGKAVSASTQVGDSGKTLTTKDYVDAQVATGSDDQTLNLTGDTLSIEDGNSVDLSGYLDNTDDQTLSEILGVSTDAGGNKITNLGTPTIGSDAATKTYVDDLVNGLTWKDPIETGEVDAESKYGTCDDTTESWATYNKNDDTIYICNGDEWIEMSSTIGVPFATDTTPGKVQLTGEITGSYNNVLIADNVIDESNLKATNSATDEYLLSFDNATNGFTWIDPSTLTTTETNDLTSAVTWANIPDANITESSVTQHQGAIDHGSIAGLGDDDHTQYALLAGRSGGQSLTGGTDSGDNLILSSTTDATKGAINLGSIAYIDEVNGRVGIGTSSPTQKLDVAGNGNFSGKVTSASTESGDSNTTLTTKDYVDDALLNAIGGVSTDSITDGDNDTKIQVEESSDEDKIRFDTLGQERMIIDNSGNVGIGTTSPGGYDRDTKLHIKGNGTGVTGRTDFIVQNTSSDSAASFRLMNSLGHSFSAQLSGSAFAIGEQASIGTSEAVDLYLSTNGNVSSGGTGDIYFRPGGYSSSAITMKVGANGNVGIGTTSPSSSLSVYSTNNINSGTNLTNGVAALKIADGTSIGLLIDTNQIEQMDQTNALYINFNSSAKTILNQGGGNVGIGTLSPTEKLDVAGNINFTGELNVNNSPGTNGQVLISSGDGAAPTWKNANTVGTTDHGALTGLTDDDHTQYALLAGRSGGQSLTGGTGSGDDLTLSSTANATKGTINLGSTAYIDEVNGRVGIGTTSANAKLHVKTNTGTNSEIDIQTANLTHWGIYHDETTEDLRFWNTNDQVSITNTGNVSITGKAVSASTQVGDSGTTLTTKDYVDAQVATGSDDQTLSEILTASTDAGGNTISNLASPSNGSDAATKTYVDDLINGLTWKDPIETTETDAESKYGTCDDTTESWATYNKNDDTIYICNGDEWIEMSSTIGVPFATDTTPGKVQLTGEITGSYNNVLIADNVIDESNLKATNSATDEYLLSFDNATNGFTWIDPSTLTTTETNDLTSAVTWANVPDANITESSVTQHQGAIDHGSIAGLGDDDHTQYALLAGRSGGQILKGGTGTTDDLTLQTTSGVGTTGADMHFLTGNNGATEAMTILNNGNVGIGTTSPNANLEVHGIGTLTQKLYTDDTSNSRAVLQFNMGTTSYGWDMGTNIYKDGSDNFLFRELDAGLSGGSESRLVLVKGGNVGIGTTSPGAKLEVAGQVKITGGTPGAGKVLTSDANGLATWSALPSGADNLGNHVATQNVQLNGYYLSGDGGNEGVYVDSSGNVGIGTSSPTEKLKVKNDNAGGTSIEVDNSSTSASAYSRFISRANSGSTSLMSLSSNWNTSNQYIANSTILESSSMSNGINISTTVDSPIRFWQAGGEVLRINTGGNVGIGTTSPSEKLEVNGNAKATAFLQSSDERLKENIETLTSPVESIRALRGVSFTWKETKQKSIGFIAQELEKVFPELIATDPVTGMKSIQYDGIIPVLVEAFQDLYEENEQLKKDLEATNAKLQELEGQMDVLLERMEKLEQGSSVSSAL